MVLFVEGLLACVFAGLQVFAMRNMVKSRLYSVVKEVRVCATSAGGFAPCDIDTCNVSFPACDCCVWASCVVTEKLDHPMSIMLTVSQ